MDLNFNFIYEIRTKYNNDETNIIFYLIYGIEPDDLTELVYDNLPIGQIKWLVKIVNRIYKK